MTLDAVLARQGHHDLGAVTAEIDGGRFVGHEMFLLLAFVLRGTGGIPRRQMTIDVPLHQLRCRASEMGRPLRKLRRVVHAG